MFYVSVFQRRHCRQIIKVWSASRLATLSALVALLLGVAGFSNAEEMQRYDDSRIDYRGDYDQHPGWSGHESDEGRHDHYWHRRHHWRPPPMECEWREEVVLNSHIRGYIAWLDGFGNFSDQIARWYQSSRPTNPYYGRNDVRYLIVNTGTGRDGRSPVFEADVQVIGTRQYCWR